MGELDVRRQAPACRMKMLGAEVRPVISGSRTLKDATNEVIRIGSAIGRHLLSDRFRGGGPIPLSRYMVARFQSVAKRFKASCPKNRTEVIRIKSSPVSGRKSMLQGHLPFLDNPSRYPVAVVRAAGREH